MNDFASRPALSAASRLIVGMALATALILAHAIAAFSADSMSIEELMKEKKKGRWTSYVESQTPLKIEGRYSSYSPRLLRFLKSDDLNFVWHDEEQSLPLDPVALHKQTQTVEVYGHFGTRSGKIAFLVEQIRAMPRDEEIVQTRKLALVDEPAERWYELADWAMKRGTFYNDPELQSEARRSYTEGIRRERSILGDEALDAKISLAKKYVAYGLSDVERVALLHEAFSRNWRTVRSRNPNTDQLEQLSDRIREWLEGSGTPLDPRFNPLRARYALDPEGFYQASSTAVRRRLNRILFSEVRYAYLQAWAKEHGSDGVQLADRIDREVPERHAEAETLRDRALEDRLSTVTRLDRREMLNLADQFERRQNPEKALQAKREWVAAQEKRLREEGRPDDLLQAAREYLSILNDKETAAKLLIEAYQKAPQMRELSDQIEQLGWTLVNGKWLSAAQKAALPADPFQKAADAGRFTGMTPDQVRKAIGSNPDSVTRIISAGRLNEVWIYVENDRSRLAIHFLGGSDGHDLKVVRLVQ